jgi:Resolvase, N terminal domain
LLRLREGDVLMVTRIDRLARSIGYLQDIVRAVRARGASLKATEQPIDTSTAAGKCFLDMLGVFAEFETNLRRERQLEGIAKAKAAGVYKGRPASIDAAQVRAMKAQGLHILQRGVGARSIGRAAIEERGNATSVGNQLVKQSDAGRVAAGSGEAGDKTKLDRVLTDAEHDRNRRSRCFGRDSSGLRDDGSDHGHPTADQVGHQCRPGYRVVPFQPMVLDRHVPAFDIAGSPRRRLQEAFPARRCRASWTVRPSYRQFEKLSIAEQRARLARQTGAAHDADGRDGKTRSAGAAD